VTLAEVWSRVSAYLEIHAATEEEANGDHMAEEERGGLTDFRQTGSLQQGHDLAIEFIGLEARNYEGVQPVDRDAATYVREAERPTADERRRANSGSIA
jgi:hypothetical protein